MRLKPVPTSPQSFDLYRPYIDNRLFNEVKNLAKSFQNKRVLHINATPRGGGVDRILDSLVPMAKGLGIEAERQVLEVEADFFVITKKIHNSLQGGNELVREAEWQYYEMVNQQLASQIATDNWDYIFIHDPQPGAIAHYLPISNSVKIWRCHLDLSRPNATVAKHFQAYLPSYNGAIFTLPQYILPSLKISQIAAMPMAIDPLAPINRLVNLREARQLVAGLRVDIRKPIVVQVSRFDAWKDPVGVVKAWRLARRVVPNLQLVLIGDESVDDPEGKSILAQVIKVAQDEKQVFVVTDADDKTVQAFRRVARVVLQKSLREGFGLTVSEALWAKTPVIGGRAGGIPLQIKEGRSGYLATSIHQTAERIVELVQNPLRAQRMGAWGHEYVRGHFLMPRLLRDELKFLLRLSRHLS